MGDGRGCNNSVWKSDLHATCYRAGADKNNVVFVRRVNSESVLRLCESGQLSSRKVRFFGVDFPSSVWAHLMRIPNFLLAV